MLSKKMVEAGQAGRTDVTNRRELIGSPASLNKSKTKHTTILSFFFLSLMQNIFSDLTYDVIYHKLNPKIYFEYGADDSIMIIKAHDFYIHFSFYLNMELMMVL